MSDTRRTVQRHPIAPVWDETSRILILGSFPSVKSREANFFTGIRRTVSGACWPPYSAAISRKARKKKSAFCSRITSRSGTSSEAAKSPVPMSALWDVLLKVFV